MLLYNAKGHLEDESPTIVRKNQGNYPETVESVPNDAKDKLGGTECIVRKMTKQKVNGRENTQKIKRTTIAYPR